MLAVMESLQLDPVEQMSFLNRFSATTPLGDISPVVFHNRAEFVDRILLDQELAENDDTRPWRILQIALSWYVSMLQDRRCAGAAEKRPAQFILPIDPPKGGSVRAARQQSDEFFKEIDARLDQAET
jgi:hypothetical protein